MTGRFLAVAVISFIIGIVVENHHLDRLQLAFFEDGMPLAMIPAGTQLADNHYGVGVVTGDVRAGQDLAVVLLNGRTYVRPNALVPPPCGDPDPLSPHPEDVPSTRCKAMMIIGDSVSSVNNVTFYNSPEPVLDWTVSP